MARNFNGASGDIQTGSDAALDNLFQADVTILTWIKPDTTGEGATGRICSKRGTDAEGGGGFLFFTDDVASLGAQTADDVPSVEATSRGADNAITLGAWNAVALTYSDGGDKKLKIYANDGTAEIGYTTQTAGTTSPGTDAGRNFFIGNTGAESTGDTRTFDGDIAWMTVYNAVLASAELDAFMNGKNPMRIRPNSLVACWPLWGVHSPEINLVNALHSGTITGTIIQSDGPPMEPWTPNLAATMPFIVAVAAAGNPYYAYAQQ